MKFPKIATTKGWPACNTADDKDRLAFTHSFPVHGLPSRLGQARLQLKYQLTYFVTCCLSCALVPTLELEASHGSTVSATDQLASPGSGSSATLSISTRTPSLARRGQADFMNLAKLALHLAADERCALWAQAIAFLGTSKPLVRSLFQAPCTDNDLRLSSPSRQTLVNSR